MLAGKGRIARELAPVRDVASGLYTTDLPNKIINEQMIRFWASQGVGVMGVATILKKIGANSAIVEARGGRLRAGWNVSEATAGREC